MIKKVHLQTYLTSAELKTRSQSTSDRVESRCWYLLWLVSKGWTLQQAAQAVELNYDYAEEIVKSYNQQGEQAIANHHRQQRELLPYTLLNTRQLEEFRRSRKPSLPAQSLPTSPKVAQGMVKRTGEIRIQREWDYYKPGRYSPHSPPISNQPPEPPKPPKPPLKSPLFWLGILLNSIVWLLVIVFWQITPPQYTSEWGIKILATETGVELDLPSVGRASPRNDSGRNRQDTKNDYLYIANSPAVLEKAAEQLGMSASEFGKPEITADDDSNIISLSIEGDDPTQAQQKAYTLHQVLTQELELLREDELERQEQQTQETLQEARQKLDAAQKRLSSYQASSSVSSQEQVRNIASNLEQLRRLQAELSAQERGIDNSSRQLEQELELSSTEAAAVYQLLEDEVYQVQLQQYTEAQTELTKLLSRYTAENPLVMAQQAELEEATGALQQRAEFLLQRPVNREELERITFLALDPKVKTVRSEIFEDLVTDRADQQRLAAQIQELEQQIEALENRRRTLGQDKLQLDSLNRDLQVAEAIFTATLAKLDLGKESIYSLYPPVQLIREPNLPKENKPTSPNLRLLLLAGMAGSFLVTTGLILLWFEQQPSRLESPKLRKSLSSFSFVSKTNKTS